MNENLLTEIRKKALRDEVPIMDEDSLFYIREFIGNYGITDLLEIGTAVGYSASVLCSGNPQLRITTLEIDSERYQEAVMNFERLNLRDRITAVNIDALQYECSDTFDAILLDGPKSKNRQLMQHFKPNLKEKGCFIIDDVYFHGFISHPEVVRTRRLRTLVNKFSRFVEEIRNDPEYECTYLEIGDGLLIAQKRS